MNTRPVIARALVVVMLTVQTLVWPAAHAAMAGTEFNGMIGTNDLLAQEQRAENTARLQAALERSEATSALERFGVDPARIAERLDRLSDAELASLADQADELPAGEGALGVLLFILVLLIVLDLLGVTNVFPRI